MVVLGRHIGNHEFRMGLAVVYGPVAIHLHAKRRHGKIAGRLLHVARSGRPGEAPLAGIGSIPGSGVGNHDGIGSEFALEAFREDEAHLHILQGGRHIYGRELIHANGEVRAAFVIRKVPTGIPVLGRGHGEGVVTAAQRNSLGNVDIMVIVPGPAIGRTDNVHHEVPQDVVGLGGVGSLLDRGEGKGSVTLGQRVLGPAGCHGGSDCNYIENLFHNLLFVKEFNVVQIQHVAGI